MKNTNTWILEDFVLELLAFARGDTPACTLVDGSWASLLLESPGAWRTTFLWGLDITWGDLRATKIWFYYIHKYSFNLKSIL